MKKYFTILASFIIMLCIGSVYAWSIVAGELIENYQFSALQSQLIFGTLIATFPVTMIFVGQLSTKIKHRFFGYIAGLLFMAGYLLASYSQGSFAYVLLGIGLLSGISTGFGYWVSLTTPVLWFPNKKGLVTGIAAAGFGLGAVFMSEIAEIIMNHGCNILEVLRLMGISYGVIILVASTLISQAPIANFSTEKPIQRKEFINSSIFRKLFIGIFLGTFAGLLIIGSLRLIGAQYNISNHILILGVALFAIANFVGRLSWGVFSDRFGASLSIFLALLFQSAAIISLNIFNHSGESYLLLSMLIGFGFGGNFVLFAKETAQLYGVKNLGVVYPYVFIGYAIAGIAGPMSGGLLFDYSNSFSTAIVLASIMSLLGSILFLKHFFESKYK